MTAGWPILLLLSSCILHVCCPALAASLLKHRALSGYNTGPNSGTRPLRIAEVLSLQTPSPYGGAADAAVNSAEGEGNSSSIGGAQAGVPKLSKNNQLKYFQGPLVVTSSPVHVIYYGNWKTRGQKTRAAIKSFIASITATTPSGPGSVVSWWKMNTLLTQKNGQRATSSVYLKSEKWDWYSQGKVLLNDSPQIFKVVKRQLDRGWIKHTPGAMYVVVTSPDVKVGDMYNGFCSLYCGWHDYRQHTPPGGLKKQDIYYSFVGDASTQCPGACGISERTPSGSIDALVDTFAHEIAEIATDPDVMTGWLTDQAAWGQENADICRREYLNQRKWVSNGVTYNYNLEGAGGAKFMVQANYNPVKAQCTMSP